jgi:cytidine deaminase
MAEESTQDFSFILLPCFSKPISIYFCTSIRQGMARTSGDYQALIRAAKQAKRLAYAPYSHFRVGAAIRTRQGKVYTGCNVEISSYGLTICAERTAIFKAISEGEREFTAIAVASDDPDYCPPCGACRQVLMDLAPAVDFIMINKKGQDKVVRLKDLFPYPFGPDHLPHRRKKKS